MRDNPPRPSALVVDVEKRIGEIALTVNLAFRAGVTALVGPSGAGKSTLIRLIAGLVQADSGTIRLGDALLDDSARGFHLAPGRRGISLVFQEYALFPHLSVSANVAYGLKARRVARSEQHRRVQAMLERLGIASLADVRPDRLSGGQRQRVALARALVLEPRALLLDEPLSALDVQTRAAVRQELREILGGLDIPTILVTHDYADALAFRDRVVILVDGKVIQDGSHADLLAHPKSRFVADFTGINFFTGIMAGHDAESLARIDIPGGVELFASVDDTRPGLVDVGLKPWDITLFQRATEGSARNVLLGVVREVLPLGGRMRVVLGVGETRGVPVVAEVSHEALDALDCHPGQLLYAAFKATALSVNR
jgi:molybdenum ABC transporter ATP-binding protein